MCSYFYCTDEQAEVYKSDLLNATKQVTELGPKPKASWLQSQSSSPPCYRFFQAPRTKATASKVGLYIFSHPEFMFKIPLTSASLNFHGDFYPLTSDLGVHGRTVRSTSRMIHSLGSLLRDPTSCFPHTFISGYDVPFYYQTSPTPPHLGKLYSATQKQNYDVVAWLHK